MLARVNQGQSVRNYNKILIKSMKNIKNQKRLNLRMIISKKDYQNFIKHANNKSTCFSKD